VAPTKGCCDVGPLEIVSRDEQRRRINFCGRVCKGIARVEQSGVPHATSSLGPVIN